MAHAYLIIGEFGAAVEYLENNLTVNAPPRRFETFGIEESRELKAEQARRLAPGETLDLVVACGTITVEAQNALLKTFEEPTAGVHFFFLLSESRDLLPTLISRCELVELANIASADTVKLVDDFIAATLEERLALVPSIADPKTFATELLGRTKRADLERAVCFLHDRAALPRLVLEHLAVIL